MILTPNNINQYYLHKQFRNDFLSFTNRLESTLKQVDNDLNMEFPRPYTGNIYWFIVMLSNIYYLDRVIDKTGLERNGITKLDFSDIGFKNLTFDGHYQGWENKIKILTSMAKDIEEPNHNNHPFLKLKDDIRKVIRVLTRKRFYRKRNKNLFVIQGGYEVEKIRPYLKEHNFVFPIPVMQKKEYKADIIGFPTKLGVFIDAEFESKAGFLVSRLFWKYHLNVVMEIPSFISNMRAQFFMKQPEALLYSIGANTVIEDVFGWEANNRNIPVFYFQHGGGLAFGNDPFEKYIEKNPNIRKTTIYKAKREWLNNTLGIYT